MILSENHPFLMKLFDKRSLKNVKAQSSDGGIFNVSFKLRFQISKTNLWKNDVKLKQFATQKVQSYDHAEKVLKPKLDDLNNQNEFIDFPIQIISSICKPSK